MSPEPKGEGCLAAEACGIHAACPALVKQGFLLAYQDKGMQVVDRWSFKACSRLNNTFSVHAVHTILLILFFLSGICGLIYEVVWSRMLTLVMGHKEGVQCIR